MMKEMEGKEIRVQEGILRKKKKRKKRIHCNPKKDRKSFAEQLAEDADAVMLLM